MMKSIKSLWVYLDGKKTAIASIYWTISTLVIPIWFPMGLSADTVLYKLNLSIGTLLTFAGLGHKAYKTITKESV
jgi:hypothetical protein